MFKVMKLGYDECGSGPVLLLVHGFPVNREIWAGQLTGLSGIRRVVGPDLRGRGKSPAPDATAWSIDTHAWDLAQTIDALGTGPVDLAGLSMGGYVAFALLRLRPDLVRSLILVSTRAAADPPDYRMGRAITAERAERYGTAALAASMIDKLLTPAAGQKVRQRVLAMFDAVPGTTSAADSRAMGDRTDSTPMLASMALPCLVVEGAQESLLPPGTGSRLAAAIPGARHVLIPGAAHFVPIENPAAFNAALKAFLTGPAASPQGDRPLATPEVSDV